MRQVSGIPKLNIELIRCLDPPKDVVEHLRLMTLHLPLPSPVRALPHAASDAGCKRAGEVQPVPHIEGPVVRQRHVVGTAVAFTVERAREFPAPHLLTLCGSTPWL